MSNDLFERIQEAVQVLNEAPDHKNVNAALQNVHKLAGKLPDRIDHASQINPAFKKAIGDLDNALNGLSSIVWGR